MLPSITSLPPGSLAEEALALLGLLVWPLSLRGSLSLGFVRKVSAQRLLEISKF